MEKLKANKKLIAMVAAMVVAAVTAFSADFGEVVRDVCAQVAPAPVQE